MGGPWGSLREGVPKREGGRGGGGGMSISLSRGDAMDNFSSGLSLLLQDSRRVHKSYSQESESIGFSVSARVEKFGVGHLCGRAKALKRAGVPPHAAPRSPGDL